MEGGVERVAGVRSKEEGMRNPFGEKLGFPHSGV
jgi:hypothetical protein